MNAETLSPAVGRKIAVIFPVLGLLFTALCAALVYATGDYGTLKKAVTLGRLFLCAGIALDIFCILTILRKQTPDSDDDTDKESRLIQRTLIILLLDIPVAVLFFLALGWISKWPLCVVTLNNASGKDMDQVEVMEPYGKEAVWVTLQVPAGEETTARFPLKQFSGEGNMSVFFNIQRSSQTCAIKGDFSPRHPGNARVRVKPDLSCE